MIPMRITNLSGQSVFRSALKSKGSILILALWSLCLLSAFAVILNYQIRQALVLASRIDQKDKMRWIAAAGVAKVMAELKHSPAQTYDYLADPWSNNPAAFRDIPVGDGEFTLEYFYPDTYSAVAQAGYGCVDEERKLNINQVEPEVLTRFFRVVLSVDESLAQELAACIVDWRDADSQLSIPTGSAEYFYYSSLPFSYPAKNADFEVLEELLLVKGFSENVFEKIKDYVTIYGSGRVNINTTTQVILFALGLDEDLAAKIILYRMGPDGLGQTPDDNVFVSQSEIVPKLSQFYAFSSAQIDQLNRIVSQYIAVGSNNFLIKSTAKLSGKNTLTVFSVVNRDGKVLYWREN